MKIGVVYNKYIKNNTELIKTLNTSLTDNNTDFEIMDSESLKPDFGFVFAIGGDGTILNVAKYYAKYSIPVSGINLGRLGFLAQSELGQFPEIIKEIQRSNYKTEERMMLEYENISALNDFVIKGSKNTRTTKLTVKINAGIVSEYVSDGLIISTPTGSTAYCLSAGGPIVSPAIDAIIIVPICPHTLTARPLVVPACENITVTSEYGNLAVAVDGSNLNVEIQSITVKKSEYKAKLAFLPDNNFYNILAEKLFWGISPCKK